MHLLLAEGNASYVVNRYETDIAPMLQTALALMAESGWAEQAAYWHLRTQGLRAQRQAMLQGLPDDPELAELQRLIELARAGQFPGSDRDKIALLGGSYDVPFAWVLQKVDQMLAAR